jgi:hypothetical protein
MAWTTPFFEAEEEAEAAEEEKIRLKTICLPSFEGET